MKHIKLFEKYISETSQFVYHGSNKKFKEFDFSKIGKGTGGSYYGYGIYFTEDKQEAKRYAEKLVERKGGKPYLYTVDIKGMKFYELDDAENIKLSENEREHILNKLRDKLIPEEIKIVRIFHPDYEYGDEHGFEDYIYNGNNGEFIKDKKIESLRNNFTHKKYPYSAMSFFYETLPKILGSSKITSDFLNECGYDGISYIDDGNRRGYVIFKNNINDINVTLI